jgi:hypothetical protein
MRVDGLEIGFLLDRQWHLLRGEMEQSKRPSLLLLARTLDQARTPYAVIGGVALQVHQREPRTTLDIDLAVAAREQIPRQALLAAGFEASGTFEHTENWKGPDGTPVQFTDDAALVPAIARAEEVRLEGVPLRVLRAARRGPSAREAAGRRRPGSAAIEAPAGSGRRSGADRGRPEAGRRAQRRGAGTPRSVAWVTRVILAPAERGAGQGATCRHR